MMASHRLHMQSTFLGSKKKKKRLATPNQNLWLVLSFFAFQKSSFPTQKESLDMVYSLLRTTVTLALAIPFILEDK